MKITRDKISQATYIAFSEESVIKTRAFFRSKIMIDFGEKNRVIGIEILGLIFSFGKFSELISNWWCFMKKPFRPKKVESLGVASISSRIQNSQ